MSHEGKRLQCMIFALAHALFDDFRCAALFLATVQGQTP